MTSFSIDINSANASHHLFNHLRQCVSKEFVILGIGCDKIIGDSLGPLVGTMLNNRTKSSCYIYGMLDSNVNAVNIDIAINFIKQLHHDANIVVVDAAVGSDGEIGCLQSYPGPINPGSATQKQLQSIGDVSIIGVITNKQMKDFYTLNITKKKLVHKMAEAITDALAKLDKQIKQIS